MAARSFHRYFSLLIYTSTSDRSSILLALFKRDKVKLNYVVLVVSIRSGLRFVQLGKC